MEHGIIPQKKLEEIHALLKAETEIFGGKYLLLYNDAFVPTIGTKFSVQLPDAIQR